MNFATSCINVAVGGLDCFINRHLVNFSGEVPEDGDFVPPNSDWEAYWRCLFPKVTQKDIEEFEKKYKGTGVFPS